MGCGPTVRARVFPEVQPKYVGYLAWRGMLEEHQATPAFVDSCFASLNFCFPKGEELIGYPVAGADGAVNAGHRQFNIMWYRPVAPGAVSARHVHGNRRRSITRREFPRASFGPNWSRP